MVRTFEMAPGHAGRMGLHVGSSNVREYFPRRVGAIELVLDHLCIICALGAEFWEGRPEIHDPRLSLWLEAKRMGGKLTGAAATLAMIPAGQDAFRLEVMALEEAKRDAANRDMADYALTGAAVSLTGMAPRRDGLPAAGALPGIDALPADVSRMDAVAAPGMAPVPAPVMAFDRRKRSIPHDPERRGLIN